MGVTSGETVLFDMLFFSLCILYLSLYFYWRYLIDNIILVLVSNMVDSIFLQIIFHLKLLQNNGYISLCYTIYLCFSFHS